MVTINKVTIYFLDTIMHSVNDGINEPPQSFLFSEHTNASKE